MEMSGRRRLVGLFIAKADVCKIMMEMEMEMELLLVLA
jgi:hypothetical protein